MDDLILKDVNYRLSVYGMALVHNNYWEPERSPFDLWHFPVVAAHVSCRLRSIDRDRETMADRCFIQIHIGSR